MPDTTFQKGSTIVTSLRMNGSPVDGDTLADSKEQVLTGLAMIDRFVGFGCFCVLENKWFRFTKHQIGVDAITGEPIYSSGVEDDDFQEESGSAILDEILSSTSENGLKNKTVYEELNKRQEKLVLGENLDALPARGSDNPITSDGVSKAIQSVTGGVTYVGIFATYEELTTTVENPMEGFWGIVETDDLHDNSKTKYIYSNVLSDWGYSGKISDLSVSVDDNASLGDNDVTWSADKSRREINKLHQLYEPSIQLYKDEYYIYRNDVYLCTTNVLSADNLSFESLQIGTMELVIGNGIKCFDAISDMKSAIAKDGDIAFCIDKHYTYLSDNEEHVTLGKWRELKGTSGSGGDATTTEDITVLGSPVGALDEGTVIPIDTSFNDFVKMLCTKVINPTYISPSVGVNLSPSGLQEIGTTISVVIVPTFTKNDGGDMTSCKIYRDGTLISTQTDLSSYTDSITINSNTVYSATIEYGDGDVKQTNTGIDYPMGQIMAGEKSGNKTLSAVHASYYGAVDTLTPTDEEIKVLTKDLRMSKGKTVDGITMDNKRFCFCYPTSIGTDLTSILDGNGFQYLSSYNKSAVTIDGVNYTVYVMTNPATVTNFKQIFA